MAFDLVALERLDKRIREVRAESKMRLAAGRPNITLQAYEPDTCGCYLTELVDEEKSEPDRVTLDHVCEKCPAHVILDDPDCYHAITHGPHSEQKRKNLLLKFMMEDPETGLSRQTWNTQLEQFETDIPDDLVTEWNFSGVGKDRVLTVTLIERGTATRARRPYQLSPAQLIRLRNHADSLGSIIIN
jgi:hypothetical protein